MKGSKHPKLLVNDYEFVIDKRRGDRTRWRCNNYSKQKTGCKAAFTTSGNTVNLYCDHNHPPTLKPHNGPLAKQIVFFKRVK